MRSTVKPAAWLARLRAAWLLFFAVGCAVCAHAEVQKIPRPEGIQPDVNFWIRVYSEVTTNEGLLHDERNLAVVYDTVKFGAVQSSRDRQRLVDERRDRHIAALRRIIAALPTEAARDALSAEDKRLLALWGPNASPILLKEATQRIRFQLGQADRFKEGLVRSSSWETHIAGNLREPGPAVRARRAAARRVFVQCRRLFEGGRRRTLAVHALNRPALHARR